MKRKSLFMQTLGASLLLVLSGCDVARSARADFNRLVSSDPAKTAPPRQAARPVHAPAKSTGPQTAAAAPAGAADSAPDANAGAAATDQTPPTLIGKSENEVRALFGPPTSVEERAPGKTWRYQDGKCALDVQLYPDVQTRQFATLAYEVKSDDSTDEGRRACLGQLQSHAQPH